MGMEKLEYDLEPVKFSKIFRFLDYINLTRSGEML